MADMSARATAAMAAVRKAHGEGSLMALKGNKEQAIAQVETISTGSFTLDRKLGVGGYPRGRIIEIMGQEASGKSTMALHAIAEVQKKGGVCAYIDAEHALDVAYCEALGIDTEALLINQPDNGEQGLEIARTLIESDGFDLIIVDSVAALVPKKELEGEIGDSHMGLQARMMGQALRILTPSISKSKTVLIFINQLRQKIGVTFGSDKTTSGGNALKFYASVRIEVTRIGGLKTGDDNYGNRVKFKVVKNKVAPPLTEGEFDIIFGHGVNRIGEILDYAIEFDIIKKSGAWFSYLGENIGQGRDNTCTYLQENPDVLEDVEAKVIKALG